MKVNRKDVRRGEGGRGVEKKRKGKKKIKMHKKIENCKQKRMKKKDMCSPCLLLNVQHFRHLVFSRIVLCLQHDSLAIGTDSVPDEWRLVQRPFFLEH
jgi:hypothetical protein